ncbi:insulinase family protein [Pseudoflavitalea rhizosphaerae]|uniref:insulinase family protein n=1 Tax=Pseudoflavitalea rhizosphaerae TaxID=1884793 RepID=UPI0024083D64|nr:insulinase family protein [Pseudoflavitalea rhizosphaerae]
MILGTTAHLKNPSLTAIRKFYNAYYVPSNMGLIMAGDFDPDLLIAYIAGKSYTHCILGAPSKFRGQNS